MDVEYGALWGVASLDQLLEIHCVGGLTFWTGLTFQILQNCHCS